MESHIKSDKHSIF